MSNEKKSLEKRAYKELFTGAFLFSIGIIIVIIASYFDMDDITAKVVSLFTTFFMGIGASYIAGSLLCYVFGPTKTEQENKEK